VADKSELLLIDVYSLVYRAFFALPPLSTSSGKPVNAAYGFQRMLARFLREEQPSHVVACFDAGIPAERLAAVPEYKAQRPETPDDLRPQFDLVRRILDGYGIATVQIEGEEADDCIATISTLAREAQLDTVVLSGDLDLLQLVAPHCTIVVTKRGITDLMRYDEAAVRARYGLSPEQLPDYRGLKGDPSDNLPGVPGIGEKTATKLIAQFGSLDALLANTESVTPKRIADLLREHADKARACRDVSRAKRDLPILPDWERWRYVQPSPERLAQLFAELEFKSLLSQVAPALASMGESPQAEGPEGAAPFEPGAYSVLEDDAEAERKLDEALAAKRVALTLVPALASWRTESPLALALSWAPKTGVVIPAATLAHAGVRERVTRLLGAQARALVVYDLKNVSGWAARFGATLEGVELDALLAAAVADPVRGEPTLEQALVGTPGEGAAKEDNVKASTLFDAAAPVRPEMAQAADGLLRAADARLASIKRDGLDRVLFEIEQPLAPVLAKMESVGFRIDRDELERIRASLARDIEATAREIYRLAGTEFNINSPKALGTVLFEQLGLPGKKTKTGYATGAEVLGPLAQEHEIAAKLLQYREASKLKSTYVDALPALIDPATGLLHTTLRQIGAATGRLSSTDPNLQNIPVRSSVGREIRRTFLPATPGNVLLAADYSQIELRILAHLSKDERFIEAFRRGDDIHAFTARTVFGVAEGEPISRDLRRRAKAVNFGILYGISDFGLSQSAGMSRDEAKRFIADYLARFPKIKGYIDGTLENARAKGFVTTLFGRRRYLPDLRSRVYPLRAAAERMAINAPAQGSAADLIKLAMVEVDRVFSRERVAARLALQVHDELIFDVPEGEVQRVSALVRDAMEHAMTLDVPIVVDCKVGPNWEQVETVDDLADARTA
jgi:DNA polymerase-1